MGVHANIETFCAVFGIGFRTFIYISDLGMINSCATLSIIGEKFLGNRSIFDIR
jgi:uncharacterized membrane protein YdjX (TVP38/TMEM64 family)